MTHSGFFEAWATLVLRYRWAVLALLISVTLAASYQIMTRLVIDHSVDSFAPPDSPEMMILSMPSAALLLNVHSRPA